MPKEQINHLPFSAGAVEKDYASATGMDSALHVGWNKDGEWVQVGLEVELSYAAMAISLPNGSTSNRTVMWTPVLSPPEIDGMIRVLRKAKRKAYGNA